MRSHISRLTLHADGFTLLELLVAVSILIIIGGASYTAFNVALDVYQKSESRIVMTQKCRIALERVATDLSNLQAVQGDESLVIVSQDNPIEEGINRDLISFVTLIHIDPDPFLAELNAANQTVVADEDLNQDNFVSDVQRIAYYIGEDTARQIGSEQENRTEVGGEFLTADSEVESGLALYRLSTTALEVETVIQPLLDSQSLPTEDEAGNPIYVNIVPIIDQITSFDVRYYDGEEWYESWDDTEMIPTSVVVWITVGGGNSQQSENTSSSTITQSTMVYLPMSVNFSEQPPGGAAAGPGG
ncbi:prepilin-type N-terminal cleavage/methylation domain-containing protein [Candidatus Poribacteria bacterium]|nr:prepilin-type N-terminal cleavage/methylation domain-containing protein [Candidatus Poribacteria bacterium]